MRLVMREIKEHLARAIAAAVDSARKEGLLAASVPDDAVFTVPKDRAHGDLSTNAALVAARHAGLSPRQTAQAILDRMPSIPLLERAEVAGPGFINFFLAASWRDEIIRETLAQGADYGRCPDLAGRRIQLEFVSANPVGPLNVVNARAGALGDSLARLMQFAGATVEREYYVNDHGAQVWILGRSLEARCRELRGEPVAFPEEGYQGGYLYDLAREFVAQCKPDFWDRPEEERIKACRDFALQRMLQGQQADLASYGVVYDRWFSESVLHERGAVENVLHSLQARGKTFEQDGAIWLRTTEHGDDKDRVLRTSDGRPTYLLADIAYHLDKLERGYDLIIDIWGPDHHGHIGRMKAALAAAGVDPGRLEILIAQQINLLRDGQPVKMSKRAGEFVTMRDLLDEVGNDAARFFFLMRSAESHLDFDLAVAVAASNENPVYYIQYAHARVASILRQAAAAGYDPPAPSSFPAGRLTLPEELRLADEAALLPEVVAEAARLREPHRLTGYLLNLAGVFHAYYNKHRVLTEDGETTLARLALVRAVQTVIANGLGLLGVSAPERM